MKVAYLKKIDWILVIAIVLLISIGLSGIYGARLNSSFNIIKRQVLFLILGLCLMLILSFFDYRVFKHRSFIIIFLYLMSLFLLFYVLFSKEIKGASSWLFLGSLGFEPAEFIKIFVILFLAKYFSLRHIEMYRVRHLIVSGLYVGSFAILIMLQPDFGSAIVLFGIWIGTVIVAGIKLKHLLILSLIICLLFMGNWFFVFKNYQKQRILTFLNPRQDPKGSGYQISQSLIAIGSGGLWGRGFAFSSQAGLKFLPEQHTDFIFAVIAEQRGLIGIFFIMLIFAILLWRIIKISLSSRNNFSRLFTASFAIMIFIQLFVNIGMNIGILPVTGLTLPLVSYGGSSLLSTFVGLGIVQSIKLRI